MRTLIRFLSILSLSVMVLLPAEKSVAQQATPDATAVANESEIITPEFSIRAVGDQSTRYFDDVEVIPGEKVELAVVISNSGDIPATLTTFKVNAHNGVNGGYVSGDPEETPTGSAAWSTYPNETFDLGPGEDKEITFDVVVPDGTAPGQYISGIVVRTADSLEIPGSEDLRQVISYAISLSILVPGEYEQSFELGDPEATSSVTVFVPVSNTGNYLVRPEGKATLMTTDGKVIHTSDIKMGSLYAGLETAVLLAFPEQVQPGAYVLSLELSDPDSGATAEIENMAIVLPEPQDPKGVNVVNAAIEPNADEIVFANVDVTLNNGGQQIPASNVTLEVLRDGEQVDEFSLATNQVLLNGENTYTTRYIPADMWESGTYTFRIVVSAVDPNGGQETILLTEDLDAEIVVP